MGVEEEYYSDEEVEPEESAANDNVDNHRRNQSDYSRAGADENDSLEGYWHEQGDDRDDNRD